MQKIPGAGAFKQKETRVMGAVTAAMIEECLPSELINFAHGRLAVPYERLAQKIQPH